MSIRIMAAGFAMTLAAAVVPGTASAQANVMKECGAEYQTAKAANSLNGQKWNDFLSACRTRKAADKGAPAATPPAATAASTSAPAAPTATAATPTAAAPATAAPTTAAKPASAGRAAMLDRERACGAEWKEKKVELRKTTPTLKWPQYWSACNKRMKAAASQ